MKIWAHKTLCKTSSGPPYYAKNTARVERPVLRRTVSLLEPTKTNPNGNDMKMKDKGTIEEGKLTGVNIFDMELNDRCGDQKSVAPDEYDQLDQKNVTAGCTDCSVPFVNQNLLIYTAVEGKELNQPTDGISTGCGGVGGEFNRARSGTDHRDCSSNTSPTESDNSSSDTIITKQEHGADDNEGSLVRSNSIVPPEGGVGCVCPSASFECNCGSDDGASDYPPSENEDAGTEEEVKRLLQELREGNARQRETIQRKQEHYEEMEATRDNLNDKFICKVDLVNQANRVFLPCRHLVCCQDCAPKLSTCPICREKIRSIIYVTIGGKPRHRRRPPAPKPQSNSIPSSESPNGPGRIRRRGPPKPKLPAV